MPFTRDAAKEAKVIKLTELAVSTGVSGNGCCWPAFMALDGVCTEPALLPKFAPMQVENTSVLTTSSPRDFTLAPGSESAAQYR
jgi:hypothetical protein